MPTVNDVLDAVADAAHLQGGRAALAAFWAGIAARSLDMAVRDVGGILAGQGLTGAQIASWTGYNSAVLGQALYWSLSQGGATLPSPMNQEDVRALDLREWLKTATLQDANGSLLKPSPLSAVAGHGNIAGGAADVRAKDWRRRTGFLSPDGSGRFMDW